MTDNPAELQVNIEIAGDEILLSPAEARDLYAQLGDLLGMNGTSRPVIPYPTGDAWESLGDWTERKEQ